MRSAKNLLLILFTIKILISRMESAIQKELNSDKDENDFISNNKEKATNGDNEINK